MYSLIYLIIDSLVNVIYITLLEIHEIYENIVIIHLQHENFIERYSLFFSTKYILEPKHTVFFR